MGAGASTASTGAKGSNGRVGSGAQASLTATGTTTVVDVVEGGVQWLAHVVDREKQEKEWLAGRYEEKCAEVQGLHKELASLRAELASAATSSSATPQATASATAAGGKMSPSQAEASPSGLMGRRGLALSIHTEKKAAGRPGMVQQVDMISPVKEEPTPKQDEVSSLKNDPYHNEPMSALLRRRSEDWGTGPMISGAVTKVNSGGSNMGTNASESMGPGISMMSLRDLRVDAQKVFSMEDCPASPKRVRGGGAGWSKLRKRLATGDHVPPANGGRGGGGGSGGTG